jgi:hypothetical protein
MVVVSPTELSGNINKYLHIAQKERVVICIGQTEAYELVKKEHPIVSDDIQLMLTGTQLKDRVHKHIDNLFNA